MSSTGRYDRICLMSSGDYWITSGHAAKILGESPRTLRSWGEKGLMVTRRTVGGQRRYSLNQVYDILARREKADAPPD